MVVTALLPEDALSGMRLGISVSESPDLDRLGLFEEHFRLTLGEITRAIVSGGGELLYGGHLRADGYTAFMKGELQRYSRRDRPLLVCLAWQVHRAMSLTELAQFADELGLLGRIACLDPDGREVDPSAGRGEAPDLDVEPELCRRSLTSMRRYMLPRQRGRVFLGGKREGFQGELPGLMQEALLTLEYRQPIYLAGGFGGATLDIARALKVDDGSWIPPSEPPQDPRYAKGYELLLETARSPEWLGLHNGLTDSENRRLAASHRPSEIAALVSLGLGRLAQEGRP